MPRQRDLNLLRWWLRVGAGRSFKAVLLYRLLYTTSVEATPACTILLDNTFT
jgi:hypothetical protein